MITIPMNDPISAHSRSSTAFDRRGVNDAADARRRDRSRADDVSQVTYHAGSDRAS
jgi:hypothetical protein